MAIPLSQNHPAGQFEPCRRPFPLVIPNRSPAGSVPNDPYLTGTPSSSTTSRQPQICPRKYHEEHSGNVSQ